jgi:methylenetetrahydrofolate reductase (NADPH)
MSQPPISFEFSAPKTEEATAALLRSQDRLAVFNPEYVSVTYGAGGSTRDGTKDAALALGQTRIPVAPHLSFGGDTKETISALLREYQQAGIHRLVALRGDRQSGFGQSKMSHAAELVTFVRAETGSHFHISVAAYPEIHPESTSVQSELTFFKEKVDAGANAAITQYFYNADAYFRYIDECQARNIELPIVPGIMPITNLKGLRRFSDICGADLPRWMVKRLEDFGDDTDAIKAFGADVVTRLCQRLIDGGAPGLHFYTLNLSKPSARILKNLGY